MEIGSEFEIELSHCEIESIKKNLIEGYLVNFGRTAIKFIIDSLVNEKGINNFLLPNYLCESILNPFVESKVSIDFYNINVNLTIDIESFNSKIKERQAVFLINYFNIQHTDEFKQYIKTLKNKIIVIEDTTHNFFDNVERLGHLEIASLRKWMGLPSGAVIKDNNNLVNKDIFCRNKDENSITVVEKRLYAGILKDTYLKWNNSAEVKEEFLKNFSEAEKILDSNLINITHMDTVSKNLLLNYNLEKLKKTRQDNYLILKEGLKRISEIEFVNPVVNESQVPLGFPIFVKKRDQFKRYLISQNVYPPVHWPTPKAIGNLNCTNPYIISSSILTIPSDQRYSLREMERIIDITKEYFRS
ncbi:hypothetical protein PGC35_02560 [Psychrobacillus sp. PGGUH221]|uniref:hypothetical protein n=1 Tax=Psychrobacillus sp. PGGUH221 TaxID=3020058 RepID=UPI0035C693CD